MLDITRHRRRGTFTSAGLLGMAILVSSSHRGHRHQRGPRRRVDRRSLESSFAGIQAGKLEGSARAYIFSFGLERMPRMDRRLIRLARKPGPRISARYALTGLAFTVRPSGACQHVHFGDLSAFQFCFLVQSLPTSCRDQLFENWCRSFEVGRVQKPAALVLGASSTASRIGAAEPRNGSAAGRPVSSDTRATNSSALASSSRSPVLRLTATTGAGLTSAATSS